MQDCMRPTRNIFTGETGGEIYREINRRIYWTRRLVVKWLCVWHTNGRVGRVLVGKYRWSSLEDTVSAQTRVLVGSVGIIRHNSQQKTKQPSELVARKLLQYGQYVLLDDLDNRVLYGIETWEIAVMTGKRIRDPAWNHQLEAETSKIQIEVNHHWVVIQPRSSDASMEQSLWTEHCTFLPSKARLPVRVKMNVNQVEKTYLGVFSHAVVVHWSYVMWAPCEPSSCVDSSR